MTRYCFLACNRVVNSIAACRVGLNAICMAFLLVAEAEGVTAHAEGLETTVGVFELLFLLLGQDCIFVFSTIVFLISCWLFPRNSFKIVVVGGSVLLILYETGISAFSRLYLGRAQSEAVCPPPCSKTKTAAVCTNSGGRPLCTHWARGAGCIPFEQTTTSNKPTSMYFVPG